VIRREFITLLGGAASAWPLAVNAQQKGLPLIGVLNPGSTDTPGAVGFYDGLRELGYTEGFNITIERRYGVWYTDRFQQLAADLVRLKVDVIVVISITVVIFCWRDCLISESMGHHDSEIMDDGGID
jgi:putative tryptophan/tyrosine transport system substrate-binding protein